MQRRTSLKRIALWAFCISLVIGLSVSTFVAHHLTSPAQKGGQDRIFLVKEGDTLNVVAEELEKEGIITRKGPFMLWGRLMGYGKNIKAGEYRLNPSIAPIRILGILSKGIVITHAVTIPEGFTAKQIAGLLEEKGLTEKTAFLTLTADLDMAKRYDISSPGLEGYLYPDTYRFSLGLSPKTIIDVMVNRFWEIVSPLKQPAAQRGLDIEEMVTLASIVEKETARPEERPIIASVFVNRLKKGMRLASDPTVIYGIKDFNGNLTKRDLSRYSPYNTYVVRGLPPGPIANPGLAAIKAVLYPAETDYLYFVSKNDGTHYFSKTLSEHNRAVAHYQKKRRKRL